MMLSSYPLWWLALPVLLLPIWWHRQKRQRLKAELLATARFLPSAPPQQLRVWQWRDRMLLLVRCVLLVTLIAWLAATIFPWRGDTVLIDSGADNAWTEQQITAAGFTSAARAALPPNALQWLRAHERDWRPAARLLIVARAGQIAMPARVPQFSHPIEVRTAPHSVAAAAPRTEQHITVAATADRAMAWQSLFAAFDVAGNAATRHKLSAEPDANTTLIVWDMPAAAPPANWRAANWWIAAADAAPRGDAVSSAPAVPAAGVARPAFPELANASTLTLNGITMKYADSARGRLWTSDAFPPRDADTARALYESWQRLSAAPSPPYATPSQIFGSTRSALPAISNARPAYWLALALLALFIIERILTHARRT
ncbi:hypothetical protein FHW58_005244 [Duganella sp. 1224]|uniref:hypothetical protein n=1 Tax=Duganella sp. 1224 TaxID=2587052 RepID=UPI00185F1E2E|nr:hypothetical protein [Duganella sp. 1224]NYE64010.1 hypothetical protein [Duganella sp. 1224]